MNIEIVQEPKFYVVRLEGNLDDVRDPFAEQLHPLIDGPIQAMVLDLSKCPRISSSGIGQLVMLVSRANAKGGRVVLAAPAPYVESILNATKLDRFFEMTTSVREARRMLSDA